VDVAAGRPAHGLRVEIWRLTPDRGRLADSRLGAEGLLKDAVVAGEGVIAGDYEVLFHIDQFYRDSGRSEPAFLTIVPFRFAIHGIEEHFHLPMKFTPWGFSLFRGA
jgi:5-hydroxyisourate hydrolase